MNAPKALNKIRIIFGVNDFLVGGMQQQFVEQIKFYDRNRFEIILVTLFDFPGKETLYGELPPDLEVHRLDFRSSLDLRNWWRVYRLLRRIKPDIVVSSLFTSNLVFRLLKPMVGYVSIAREHSTHIDRPLSRRLVNRLLAHCSYRIVAISTTVADFTSKHEGISREKFVVIHNGINKNAFQVALDRASSKDELKAEMGFGSACHLVLTVGRLTKAKNQKLLLEGFAQFQKSYPDYRLGIVGDGELRRLLEDHARNLGIAGAVIFFGSRRDVVRFYKAADAFILTSDREGFSNVCLEAMAAGLPPISTVVGGPDEYIKDGVNGFLIPARNAESIAATLDRAVKSGSGLRGNALATAEHFAIQSTVVKYEQLFNDAMGQTRGLRALLKPLWNSSGVFWLRGICFNAFEYVTGYSLERRRFKKATGYELDLKHPESLNQKINWKKIYDRNPLLVTTADKYLVHQYVGSALGTEADEVLIPLLHVTDDPADIPFDSLPDEYVIKTNHDSGGHVIVQKGEQPDRAAIVAQLKQWLSKPYGLFKHEWAYQSIPRKVIIEKLLRGEDGDLAQDYKFHVFNGTCRFIHTTPKVNGVRTGRRSLFTPEWKHLPVGWKHPEGPDIPPPPRFEDMKRIAEKLAQPFDYVRVDLYYADGRVYFGELTHYHGSGMEAFDPRSFDFEAGKWWNIIPRYWLK